MSVDVGADAWLESNDRVCLLMGTYRGKRFLRQQLDSLCQMSFTNWRLVVSDDGSDDGTLDILAEFQRTCREGQVIIRQGPRIGFLANFMRLACAPGLQADFYAFCDQDDLWQRNKLDVALDHLSRMDRNVPRLYCGRTRLIAADGEVLGMSRLFGDMPCFSNALVQSIAGANTMVFDEATRRLFERVGPDLSVASHDWWAYILVTAVGGTVRYDPVPLVDYRQHGHNVQGGNLGFAARVTRLRQLFQGRVRSWNQAHIEGLSRIRASLTEDSCALLDELISLHGSRGLSAMRRWARTRIRRTSSIDNFALMLAASVGRF